MGHPRYRPGHWQDVSYYLRRMTHWETKCSFITQPESFASNQVHHPLCVTLLAFTIMLWTFRRKKRKESSFSSNSKPHLYSRPEGTGVVNEFMSTFHNFPSIILAFGLVLLIPCGTLQPPITKHPEATCTLDEYSTGHISILPNYIAGVIEVLSDCHMGTLEYISVRGLACCSVQLTLMLILLCGDVEVNPGPYEQDKKAELKGDSFGGDTERATTGPPTEAPAEPIAVSSPSATSSASGPPTERPAEPIAVSSPSATSSASGPPMEGPADAVSSPSATSSAIGPPTEGPAIPPAVSSPSATSSASESVKDPHVPLLAMACGAAIGAVVIGAAAYSLLDPPTEGPAIPPAVSSPSATSSASGPPTEGHADATSSPSATSPAIDHPNKTKMKEKLIKAVNEGKIVIKRNTATINLAGLPGSGKTMLIDRMLGRPIKKNYFSTGVCEPTIMVDINLSPATFTVGVKQQIQSSDFIWQPINYDTSFLSQYYGADATLIRNSKDNSSGSSASSKHDIDLNNKINGILDRCGIESIEDLKTKGSLYIRDVGGQIEFQESLSLLIYGSSIYLFVFKATIDIDEKQEIIYRDKHGEVYKYQSLISTKDALLQLLASVKALQITKKSQNEKNVKPQVFIVGTHMDKLSECGITCEVINKQLDTIITDSKCKFVNYKKKKKQKNVEGIITVEEAVVMFGVDNISEIDDGRKNLCESISDLFINDNDDFEVKYRVRDILFALNLPNIKPNVLKLQECELIAKQFKIEANDVPELLRFLHLRTGILQWFDVKDLRDWVFKEPQFLFNKITALIIKTFIDSDKEDEDDVLQFRKKGIFEKEMIKTILSGETIFSGDDEPNDEKKFLDFLIHLRMVAHYYDAEAQKDKYFIPCVLNHVPSSLSKIQSDIPPLNITFKCGYCPKGLFGVLATYFIEHPWKCKEKFTITFNDDHIYKDEIAFIAVFGGLRHNVYLKMDPSKLEVTFCGCKDSSDTKLYTACNAIRTAVSKYIDDSLDHLRYNKHSVKPIMNLQCPLVGCTCTNKLNKLHEVEVGEEESKIYCKHVPQEIPSEAKYWFPKGDDNVDGSTPTLQRETGTQDNQTAGALDKGDETLDESLNAPHTGNGTRRIQEPENCCTSYVKYTAAALITTTGLTSLAGSVILFIIGSIYSDNYTYGAIAPLLVGVAFLLAAGVALVIICYKHYKK